MGYMSTLELVRPTSSMTYEILFVDDTSISLCKFFL